MSKNIVAILALTIFASHSIGDVGFPNSRFFIKTVLSGPQLNEISFFYCPLAHSNEQKGDCLRLSSCSYRDSYVAVGAMTISDKTVRDEIQNLSRMSLESAQPADKFLPSMLKVLSAIDGGRNCKLARTEEITAFSAKTDTVPHAKKESSDQTH